MSSSKRPILTASHVEVPAKRTKRATSDVAPPIVASQPIRPMRDLSGLTFDAGTKVDLSLFPGVGPPVSVPSCHSRDSGAANPFAHPFHSAATVPLVNARHLAGSSGTRGR